MASLNATDSFKFVDDIPTWSAKLDELGPILIKQERLRSVLFREPKKSKSTESLFPQTHDGDDDENQPGRAVRRKRKSESNPTAMIIVFYESEVQDIFEGIVRSIATARNHLRKGRMALQMRQMASMEGDSVRNARLAFARMPRARGAGDEKKSAFDTIDQHLEAAQSLSEHGAHQFLREGDCSVEISAIKKRLAEVEQLARQEMEKLAREDAAKAEAEKAQAEEKRRKKREQEATAVVPAIEHAKLGSDVETEVMEVDSES